jgi:hypothetical protein
MQEDKLHGCKCRNCGIELITLNKSSDTYCRFCGAPALMAEDFDDTAIPELILPFEISKAQAKQIFLRHLSQRPLCAAALFQKVKSGFIREVYIPVRVADIQVTTEVIVLENSGNEKTKQIKSESSGANICQSRMFDEYLFRLLSEYDFSRAVAYDDTHASIPFEKPSVFSMDLCFDELEGASIKEALESLGDRKTIRKVITCQPIDKKENSKTVLVPVWILSNLSNGYTDQIFINGQTGRIVGEPPVSIKKALAIFGGIAAGCTLIGELIWMVVNGL